ncbi:hypothetical protein D3C80_956770 [compost metagenome]
MAPADGIHHILVRGRLQAIAQPGQGHAEESEQRCADQRPEQAPEAEVDKEQQQLPPRGETRANDHADKGACNFQLLFHFQPSGIDGPARALLLFLPSVAVVPQSLPIQACTSISTSTPRARPALTVERTG